MAEDTNHRSVRLTRASAGRFTVSNVRGGQLTTGTGDCADFTPVELLLAAIGACTGVDVDVVTSRRAEPTEFTVEAGADKVRDDQGSRLTGIEVTFRVAFPPDGRGPEAQALVPGLVQASHDRLCTVGRTVEAGTPITPRIL